MLAVGGSDCRWSGRGLRVEGACGSGSRQFKQVDEAGNFRRPSGTGRRSAAIYELLLCSDRVDVAGLRSSRREASAEFSGQIVETAAAAEQGKRGLAPGGKAVIDHQHAASSCASNR